ncbi:MAG: winged helix DNA-binding domain-containing protein [Oscillospiraceae bacterium]|nr:winged helix DNA-binding domain-containing protein [Oscillospiraceae bacterium]
MSDSDRNEQIIRSRMHGLYLSRKCGDIVTLSRELLGLHSWFYRNVPFSALIRGADITAWKTKLTKTWLYRGTLHGAAFEDLPDLLALHSGESYLDRHFGEELVEQFANEVLRYMEDGVFSRSEFRKIFAPDYDAEVIEAMFSPWGGVFVNLARRGLVAFRDMTSRDFDLISAEPTRTPESVLPELFRRYLAAYGPATLADAAWFFGFWKDDAKKLNALPLDEYERFELNGKIYYYIDGKTDIPDVPELTLLSGFDPLIVSYTSDNRLSLPQEYKSKVILKSGICLPTIAVNGYVAGVWNIRKNEPVAELFAKQPKRIETAALEMVDSIRRRV